MLIFSIIVHITYNHYNLWISEKCQWRSCRVSYRIFF